MKPKTGLFRIRIRPLSPWLTPWHADTLAGLLCWAYVRAEGPEALRRDLLDRFVAGQPPFVLSDAFPQDMLPFPEALRLASWPPEERKRVKRTVFLERDLFARFQQGERPSPRELLPGKPVQVVANFRNILDRTTDTTGAAGSLFSVQEQVLTKGFNRLDIYVRIAAGLESFLLDLFRCLSETGFGADVSVGRGQFEVEGGLEPADWLDPDGVGGESMVVLSTFQPAASDPIDGCWQSFVKYGKLGPDFGLDNVFKRPLIMLRPGACFRSTAMSHRPWMGRAIPMKELLPPDVVRQLRNENVELAHLAYGLAVPCSDSRG